MAERHHSADLERALADLGRHVAYPPTPGLVSRVRAGLAIAPARRPSAWQRLLARPGRLALAGLVVVVMVAATVLAASPATRTAVAERLGLRGVSVEQVPTLRQPVPSLSVPPGAGLDLGEPTTLEAVRTRLPVLVPTLPELGPPDAVYLALAPAGSRVSLVYGARPSLPPSAETGLSLLLLETRVPVGGFDPIVLHKSAGPNTRLEDVVVNGGHGVWLEGAPHLLFLPDASGQFHEDQVRLAGNVLLWEQGGLLLRLEGGLNHDQALQIAASAR